MQKNISQNAIFITNMVVGFWRSFLFMKRAIIVRRLPETEFKFISIQQHIETVHQYTVKPYH